MRLPIALTTLAIVAFAQPAGALECPSCLSHFCNETADARGVFWTEVVEGTAPGTRGFTLRILRIEGEVDAEVGEEFEISRSFADAQVGDSFFHAIFRHADDEPASLQNAHAFRIDGDTLACGISVEQALTTSLSTSCMDDVAAADPQPCRRVTISECSSVQGAGSSFTLVLAALGLAVLRRRRA